MVQRRITVAEGDYYPAYVVWELTLRCDQACAHCGSRAGGERPNELSTEEALAVVEDLSKMRTQEVVLIGGEAYLHPGFLEIARAINNAGMRATMTTGGRGIDDERAQAMKAAGIHSLSVSIDGTKDIHDQIRRNAGSFDRAVGALSSARKAGLLVAANTNINRANAGCLEALYDELKVLGIRAWQVQITAPLGRAADRPEMLLQPYDLLDIVPRLAALKTRAYDDGILIMPGNNLGYFGKEEALLRSVKLGGRDHFHGCQAGKRVMGIESDGAIKGCPSLQSVGTFDDEDNGDRGYVGGYTRTAPLAEIWQHSRELSFTRARTRDDLWGFCKSCSFADTCLSGCTFTAHAVFGKRGNNPYCHYRAQDFARRGLRERLVAGAPAPGRPFDNGSFEIVVEKSAAVDASLLPMTDLVALTRPAASARVIMERRQS